MTIEQGHGGAASPPHTDGVVTIPRSRKTRYHDQRMLIPWVRNHYLRNAKICATLLHEDGLRGKGLAARVRQFFPDIDEAAGCEVSASTLAQRGDKGVRYPSEHYSARPVTAELAELVRAHIVHEMVWEQ